jgi:hypothetical protein
MNGKITLALSASWLCGALAACSGNSDAVDNTPLEPSRDTRIESLASTACARYESCTGYGAGKPYATEAACKADFQGKAASLWPDSQCNNGQINNTRFEACVQSAEAVACDGTLVDTVVALSDCNASKVCTDPAQ